MYDSEPRPTEGKPIEEVLPAAINATATSERDCRGGELARKKTRTARIAEETEMRVMHAGSVALNFGGFSGGLVIGAAAALVLALIVLAVVLF